MLRDVLFRLRTLVRRDTMEQDLATELELHLEREAAKIAARGVAPEEAMRQARLAMGGLDRVKEGARDAWGVRVLEQTTQDIRYALRTLRRAPGFTLVALVTLALGIGANSALFSVVQGVLLAPLPFRADTELYRVTTLYPDGTPYSLSAPDFMSVREQTQTFTQVEAISSQVATMLGAGAPIEVRGTRVSDGLFEQLGLKVAFGRTFLREEHQPGRSTAVVLDHGFWQRQFGGDTQAVGRTLSLAGTTMTIVGVLAPGAQVVERTDLYAPLTYDETFSASTAQERRGEFLTVIGRARPGASPDRIDADLRRIGKDLQAAFPGTNATLTFNAMPVRDVLLGDVRTPLLVLLGAVGFVLLVACVNVANLLLARASARRAELAVRAALGAGRIRMLRQLFTEATVLGLGGAALGLGIAYLATRVLVDAQPADIPRLDNISVNGSVVWFTLAVALATSLLFGMLPAIEFGGTRLIGGLRDGARGTTGVGHTVRSALVAVEVAFAIVLLVGAGLLLRSFTELVRADQGFRPDQLVSFRVSLQGDRYREDAAVRVRVSEILERMRALPGVTSAAATNVLPLSGRGAMVGFAVENAPPPPPNVNAEIALASITPDYLATIGASLRRGRHFTEGDTADAPRVAIANEAAVRRWFANQDPIGRRVDTNGVSREIVGVAADIAQRSVAEPAVPLLFVPIGQRVSRSIKVVMRTTGDPAAVLAAVTPAIRAIDGDLAIADLGPVTEIVARSLARPRFYTSLLSVFALVALGLAAIGIFGVMSYAVSQRTREISIRMALGAGRGAVLGMVVRRAVLLALVGSGVGLLLSVGLTRVLQAQLFGITRLDPVTYGAAFVVLVVSAAVAAALPARRAASLDPAAALRDS